MSVLGAVFFSSAPQASWKYADTPCLQKKLLLSLCPGKGAKMNEVISLSKTISFTSGCLLKPRVSFNKIIIRSTDLGWFRCGFWISRKSLRYARKMIVAMMDWQTLCVSVCVCECLCSSVRTCTYMSNCKCVCACMWRKLVKSLLIYSILCTKKTRLLVFSESLWKWTSRNT